MKYNNCPLLNQIKEICRHFSVSAKYALAVIYRLNELVFNNIIYETVHVYRGWGTRVEIQGVKNVNSHWCLVLCRLLKPYWCCCW
jgi:hypothetical protein